MKAFVLAGGLPQIELLKQLKSRNITTVLADGNEHAIARPYADRFYCLPIFDIEAVKDVAIKEQVDFIITVCADQVLLVCAQVSEMLGLPCYIDYQTAQNVSDKTYMKRIFWENDIPTSRYIESQELDWDAVAKLRFPMVVKPVDAYSSRGVRKVWNNEELETCFREAAEISRSGGVIVEEFCEGEEISVDVYVENGKAKIAINSPLGMLNFEYKKRFCGFPNGVSIPPKFAAMFCIINVNAMYFFLPVEESTKYPSGKKVNNAMSFAISIEPINVM